MEQKRVMLFVFLCLVILVNGFVIVKGVGGESGVDNNNDGVVSLQELMNYIQKWINGEVSLNGLTNAIQGWIGGGTSRSSGVSDGGGTGGDGSTGNRGGAGNESEGNLSSSGIQIECSDFSKCRDICCGINEECKDGVCMYSPINFSNYIINAGCVDNDVSEKCNNFIDDDRDGNIDFVDSDCQFSLVSSMRFLGRADAYNTGSVRGIFGSNPTKYAIINDFCWDGQTRDENGVPIPNIHGLGSFLVEGVCTMVGQVFYEEIPCGGLCFNGKCEGDERIRCADFEELRFEPISSPWGDVTFVHELPSEIDVTNMSDEEIEELGNIIGHIVMNNLNLMTRSRYIGYIEKEDNESYGIEFIGEYMGSDEDCVLGFFEDIIADGGFSFLR